MAAHTSLAFPLLFISSSRSSVSLHINGGVGHRERKQEREADQIKKRKDLFLFLFLFLAKGRCWKPWPLQEPPRNAWPARRPCIWLIGWPPIIEFITRPASDATIVEVPSRWFHPFYIQINLLFLSFSFWL